jgi:hypothetical protein
VFDINFFLPRENEALLRTSDIPTVKEKKKPTSTIVKQHKPVVKKEKQLPTRTSARIRGEKPLPIKRSLELDLHNLDDSKKQKTIDSLGDKEQAQLLGLLKTTLVPNTKPKVKQEISDVSDEALTKELSQLEIRHSWATVKVIPSRINCCL